MRAHIGHHFFGSGNIGDDLMLAGFLNIAHHTLGDITLTCCTPFDRNSQQRRFPAVQWLPYDPDTRASCIEACDVWLGVGDTPFQTDVGAWFLDHLIEEADLCHRYRRPMFFFGVGLNNRDAISHPHTRALVGQAQHIWTRDAFSAALLRQIDDGARISVGADLANVALARRATSAVEPRTLGLLLNFERREAFLPEAVVEITEATSTYRHRWLIQEVRHLDGSERAILDLLPDTCRARLDVREPDYALDSVDALLDRWGAPEVLITSRYHGALVGCWLGARTIIVERNEKLTGLVEQLAVPSVKDLRSSAVLLDVMQGAAPVNRDALTALAARAERCGTELAAALSAL